MVNQLGRYLDSLAQDSARTVDAQGFLHVAISNISKATVNPYYGREIPNYESFGLDPDKVYQVLRPADELEKAATTFNNLPLLNKHIGISAFDLENPDVQRHIVGSTGSEAVFDAPYLKNSLAIYTASAIDGVINDYQRELSCAYRYDYDPTPGEFEGRSYDGRMRNIIGNHVALVQEGRAGHDVLVEDAALIGAKLKIYKALKIALDYNPYHDERGRFTGGEGGSGADVSSVSIGNKAAVARMRDAHAASGSNVLRVTDHKDMHPYSGVKSIRINHELRNDRTSDPLVKKMDSVLNRTSLPEAMTTYRGIPERVVETTFGQDGPRIGDVFGDKGYVSTSKSREVAEGFSTKYIIEISIPKGSKGYDYERPGAKPSDPGEREVLLPRDSSFRITGVEKQRTKLNDPVTVIKVEKL